LIHDYGYVAEDYQEEMEKWTDPSYYDEQVRKIQLPFTAAPTPVVSGQALEQQQQRRRENVKRLVEINAKKREERVSFHLMLFKLHESLISKWHCFELIWIDGYYCADG